MLGAQKYLALAAVWPLWEATCKLKPSWSLAVCHGGVVISDYSGGEQRIVVPSGNPADAIRRAYLLANIRVDSAAETKRRPSNSKTQP